MNKYSQNTEGKVIINITQPDTMVKSYNNSMSNFNTEIWLRGGDSYYYITTRFGDGYEALDEGYGYPTLTICESVANAFVRGYEKANM